MSQARLAEFPYSGRLEGVTVPDLLWQLGQSGLTGVLHLLHGGIDKSVYIEDGRPIFATSTHPDDRLGEQLLRDGVITLDQLDRAVSRLGSGKRLGTLLIETGAISPQDLVDGVLTQIRRIVTRLFTIDHGDYRFVEGPLPSDEVITLAMKTAEITLEGIRQVRSFSQLRRSVGPPRTRFRLVAGREKRLEGLPLSGGEQTLLESLHGEGQTVDWLCREVFLSNYEIYQALWALKVLGLVEDVDQPGSVAGEASLEGRLGRDGIAPVLVRLCRADETGVLYVNHRAVDRAFHIREGRCVFVTSSDTDDGLIAHLLRRGVISLKDREEVAKRLLSNKRVGTILRELGVINEQDLQRMVREQLSEILFDTFTWDEGDYAFVSGELPTFEDITLDMSLEDIVLAGVQRVHSWSRIQLGCGGFDTTLALTPEYLTILDRMEVGQHEWDVVTALKESRSPHEVCRAAGSPDFKVCQVLWALRVLGVVDEAAAAPAEIAAAAAVEPAVAVAEEADPPIDARHEPPVEDPAFAEPPTEMADPLLTADAAAAFGQIPEPSDTIDDHAADDPYGVETAIDAAFDTTPVGPTDDERPDSTQPVPAVASPEEVREFAGSPGEDWADESSSDGALASPPEGAEDAPPLDSPSDATCYIPRDEVAELLAPAEEPAPAFEIDAAVASTAPDGESRVEPEEPSGAEPGGSALDAPATGETLRLSRQEVEAALGNQLDPADAAEEAPPDFVSAGQAEQPLVVEASAAAEIEPQPATEPEDWQPAEPLEPIITRFNAMQRMLYRTIRSEVGAGAANFVRSCGTGLGSAGELFTEVELQSDGAWHPAELKRALVERRIAEPWDRFRRLIDEEMARLEIHIGQNRASTIRERVAALENGDEPRGEAAF